MRIEEAKLAGYWISKFINPSNSVCLNIGSSDKKFNYRRKFINELLFSVVKQNGFKFVNCDIKDDESVDEVGDIFDENFREKLKQYKAKLVICANILEHVENPRDFAKFCAEITGSGGFILFTVPYSYPYHPDPIDTMLRISSDEIAEFLPGLEKIIGEEINAGTHWDDLKAYNKHPVFALFIQIIRIFMPFYKPSTWWPAAHRMAWLFRQFRVSLVLFRKPT